MTRRRSILADLHANHCRRHPACRFARYLAALGRVTERTG